MSDNKITYHDYWAQVRGTAEEICEEAKAQADDPTRAEGIRDWILDNYHEWTDGHEWVIYYWAHPYILLHTDSANTLIETYGEDALRGKDDWTEIQAAFAQAAFDADVRDALYEMGCI